MTIFAIILYILFGPVIIALKILSFVVWEFFSNGSWKNRPKQKNLTQHWQNTALNVQRQYRELEIASSRRQEYLEAKLKEAKKQLKGQR